MKWPHLPRSKKLQAIADEDKQFCLQKHQSGKLTLVYSHTYYYQVQLQMAASSSKYCDFLNRRLIEAKKKGKRQLKIRVQKYK